MPKNAHGSIVLQTLILTAFVLVTLFIISGQISSNRKSQLRFRTNINAFRLQQNMMAYLQDPATWAATVANTTNTSLDCLRNHTICPLGSGSPFQLYDTKNNTIFAALVNSNGFTVDGLPCSTFSAMNPDDSCPIRIDFRWESQSCALPCAPTMVTVFGDFSVNAKSFEYQNSLPQSIYQIKLDVAVPP